MWEGAIIHTALGDAEAPAESSDAGGFLDAASRDSFESVASVWVGDESH